MSDETLRHLIDLCKAGRAPPEDLIDYIYKRRYPKRYALVKRLLNLSAEHRRIFDRRRYSYDWKRFIRRLPILAYFVLVGPSLIRHYRESGDRIAREFL